MKKVAKLILMLCLVLSGALCYASGVAGTENMKGEGAILIKQKAHHGGTDKSGSIVPSINGNALIVVFCENLGQVAVEVSTASGAQVDCLSVLTPNGLQVYIPNSGNYIVTFTLSDGDEYYGEFTITD
ncbi:MAG: hypothetical protein MJZ91_05970 [Bacteroidales bacterium]|nr:hypothetical protein [Bacteroidales bacterium]